ncbi:MAG: zinc ribbon domain-containing protein [archaeon]|nr:MAG: zinc ribbon domain-containing protein [archaeon]
MSGDEQQKGPDLSLVKSGTIAQELSWDVILSRGVGLYRENFTRFLTLFLPISAVLGILNSLLRYYIPLPTLPMNPTPADFQLWFPGFFSSIITLLFYTLIISWLVGSVLTGSGVRMTSEALQGKDASPFSALRFTASRIVWIWLAGLIAGILELLGFIALIVPGFVVVAMFSLVNEAIVIEGAGPLDALGRSRRLVAGRWLKTLGLLLLVGLILGAFGIAFSAVARLFGPGETFVTELLNGLVLPLSPIVTTLYYYSNVGRLSPPLPPAVMSPGVPVSTAKFCTNCGTPAGLADRFCVKCGTEIRSSTSSGVV